MQSRIDRVELLVQLKTLVLIFSLTMRVCILRITPFDHCTSHYAHYVLVENFYNYVMSYIHIDTCNTVYRYTCLFDILIHADSI